MLVIIEERLISDREFRKAFFNNPVRCLKDACIEPTSEIVKFLKNFDWPEIDRNVANFNEKLVLCSSSGY
jgi:hypothetical protein